MRPKVIFLRAERRSAVFLPLAAGMAALFAILTCSMSPLGAAEVQLYHPSVNGHRIDICLQWGSGCNGEAADVYCKAKGYDRMISWEQDENIGASQPTEVLGTGQVCDEAYCDGYLSVTCTLEDEWTQSTGHGGVVVEVIRKSGQSPEGILLVAVAEKDVHNATAAVANTNGLALLRTPPGAYRLLIHDYKNADPIPPQPNYPLDVAAGKIGNYLTVDID